MVTRISAALTARLLPCGIVVAALVLTGCGGSSKSVVRPPAPNTSSTSSSATPSTSPSTVPSSKTSTTSAHPTVAVVPDHGLVDRQRVQVSARGFTPGGALNVIECAQKGTATGPGDCNLAAMTPVTADTAGQVSVSFVVVRGPFGGNQIVCSATQPCLISVTQASLNPTEEADAEIAFAS